MRALMVVAVDEVVAAVVMTPLRGLASFIVGSGGDAPRQQRIDTVDRMLGDTLEHMAQIEVGHGVEQRGANQAANVGRALSSKSDAAEI